MCTTKPTLKDLKDLHKERENEEKRVRLAISLNICPVCGSPIITEREELLEKQNFFQRLFKITHKIWDYRKRCSKDKKHYEDKGHYYHDLF